MPGCRYPERRADRRPPADRPPGERSTGEWATVTEHVRRPVEHPDHISDPVDPVPVVNIANALTVFRLVLVPVFIALLFIGGGHDTGWRIVAAIVFAVAAITDRFDGRLARHRGLVTDFGKLADPIADKALIGTALVGLSILGDLSWWITAIIVARELGVTGLRFWVLRHGVIPASRGGKLKTLLQSVGVGLLLLPLPGVWNTLALAVTVIAAVVTVLTGLDYVGQAALLRRRAARSA